MIRLTFKNANLQGILNYTKNATLFNVGLSEAITAYEAKTGKKYDYVEPIPEEFTITDKPTLYFVKDSGIYLMTAAKLKEIPADKSHVAYAKGYSPDDEDCWEKCKNAVGGDDFAETISFSPQMQQAVTDGSDLVLKVTEKSIAVEYKVKKIK